LQKYGLEPPSELAIFSEYMEPLFQKICDETNAYASKQLNYPQRKKFKDDKWFDTTVDVIRAYFSLITIMSQVRKPRIQSYWSKNKCIETPIFRETIPRERFKQFLVFFISLMTAKPTKVIN
jgi:hypothetical protein